MATDNGGDTLADLLIRWEELHLHGQDTPASELAKDHPDLIEPLAHRIAALKAMQWLDYSLDDGAQDDHVPRTAAFVSRTLAGRYRLDTLVAEGGFAQVFRAYDAELQRTVAVKLPKPSAVASHDSFLTEARRAAHLKHDRIVPVHDVGVDDDECFIVTEYVEGGSLADRLVNGKPTRHEAVRWICDIGEALAYAHREGVLHRDIKPANILIDHHGKAKLTDFGIAQPVNSVGNFPPSLGTLRYMSPEQLEGKPADHRSDIYSLAVVLYEMLTARVPYSSVDPNVLRREIIVGSTRGWRRGVPSSLWPVCRRGLSRSPLHRQPSAAAFTADVRRSTPRAVVLWIAGGAVMAALSSLAFLLIPTPGQDLVGGERLCWEGSNGVCFVHYPEENQWKEQDEHGTPFFWFVEHDRTPEYIELLDASRNLLVRLYGDRVAVKSKSEKAAWGIMRGGNWIQQQTK